MYKSRHGWGWPMDTFLGIVKGWRLNNTDQQYSPYTLAMEGRAWDRKWKGTLGFELISFYPSTTSPRKFNGAKRISVHTWLSKQL